MINRMDTVKKPGKTEHGKGVFNWNDGSRYIGQFIDNNIEGKGKKIFRKNF